jgi:mitochondrial chaperone BCS1
MWQDIYALITENQILGGIVGGSFTVSILYFLRDLPKKFFEFLVWKFTTTLVIFNEDEAFDRVSEWLSSLEYTEKSRKLRLTANYRDGNTNIQHTPGIGNHLIWFKHRPMIVSRKIPESGNQSASYRRREDITFTMLGPNPGPMRELIEEIIDCREKVREKFVEVYLYQDYWRRVCEKMKRPLKSVVLPPTQRERIVRDIEVFLGSKAWYTARGIPYRRGLLFYGPPGCGKTSLVMALAGHFKRPIYALNLGSLKGDNALIEAVTRVPENGILLIEDIDVAQASHSRAGLNGEEKETVDKITLSGLLNSLDGTFSRDGRILVMTTNHPNNVDGALFRSGRVDLKEEIGKLQAPEAFTMCKQFLEDETLSEQVVRSIKFPITPSDLQEILLEKTPLLKEGAFGVNQGGEVSHP